MARAAAGMSESSVRLLVADAATLARPAATHRHHHPFWQLDHCAAGVIVAELQAGARRLRRGQGVLLPPGVPHLFRYRPGTRFVSWKFAWNGPVPAEPVWLDDQPGWAGLAAALAAQPTGRVPACLLAAAMHLAGAPSPASGLAAEVARVVEAHSDRRWSVGAVATVLGLSPGHARVRFRAERGMPLKRWLDARLAERAGQALAGSDLRLADLAHRFGFSDAFSFSRFFRRVAGMPPSRYRELESEAAR